MVVILLLLRLSCNYCNELPAELMKFARGVHQMSLLGLISISFKYRKQMIP